MNEFEEWMGHYDCCPTPEAYSAAKAAYQAGAAAMRERCARIAKDEQMRYTSCNSWEYGYDSAAEVIAAAIRNRRSQRYGLEGEMELIKTTYEARCPKCRSRRTKAERDSAWSTTEYNCLKCGHYWTRD